LLVFFREELRLGPLIFLGMPVLLPKLLKRKKNND
jgi:hypothetical protein